MAFSVWLILLVIFAGKLPDGPLVSQSADKYDAAVVLTGGQGRIEEGLKLYTEGKVDALYITGVGSGITMQSIVERYNEKNKDARPLKASRNLMLDDKARSTVSNATYTQKWLAGRSYKKVLLVTAGYHMPRSMLIFEKEMPKIEWVPAPVFPDNYHPQFWWKDTRALALVISEYHKYMWMQVSHLLS